MSLGPRLAVRALIVQDGKLLLVNAYPGQQSDLWCPPGGGVKRGASLPDNLRREVHEELGVAIEVGAPCLVNEYHDPKSGYHQVDVYFHARILDEITPEWTDTEGVVNRFCWVDEHELHSVRHKPDSLGRLAFGLGEGVLYDPLEVIVA